MLALNNKANELEGGKRKDGNRFSGGNGRASQLEIRLTILRTADENLGERKD